MGLKKLKRKKFYKMFGGYDDSTNANYKNWNKWLKHKHIRNERLNIENEKLIMENDCYYENCGTTSSLPRVIDEIRKTQGEVFPVRVRFCYVDKDGNKQCESGIITGVLDNGDEVYIDAETIEYIKEYKKNEKNSNFSKQRL